MLIVIHSLVLKTWFLCIIQVDWCGNHSIPGGKCSKHADFLFCMRSRCQLVMWLSLYLAAKTTNILDKKHDCCYLIWNNICKEINLNELSIVMNLFSARGCWVHANCTCNDPRARLHNSRFYFTVMQRQNVNLAV